MKNLFKNTIFKSSLGLIMLLVFGCQRDISDLEPATYPTNPEIFTDNFIGMGSNFYFPFTGDGAKPNVFSVDKTVGYNSKASIRIDVPNANDPKGSFAGAIFIVDGQARNLTGYNALTFYAKASQNVNIGTIGFGESKYQVTQNNVPFTTNWVKYVIPIPDASKLTNEKGMFLFSAGTQNTNNLGYTFWIDELKFEKLGSIAYESASILSGQNKSVTSFIGVNNLIDGLTATYSLPNGASQAINLTPYYFNFSSSNATTATVDNVGKVSTIGTGSSVITATLGGNNATGSLTINSNGNYVHAPIPTVDPSKVISIYTDKYPNVPVDYYNGYWAPYQTTQSSDFTVNGDNVLNYTNFNFVGIQTSSPTVNATSMTHFHLDLYLPNAVIAGSTFKIQVVDFGADGVYGGTDNKTGVYTVSGATLQSQNWISLDIPLSAITGLTTKGHIGQIIFEGTKITNFYADNIYFHN